MGVSIEERPDSRTFVRSGQQAVTFALEAAVTIPRGHATDPLGSPARLARGFQRSRNGRCNSGWRGATEDLEPCVQAGKERPTESRSPVRPTLSIRITAAETGNSSGYPEVWSNAERTEGVDTTEALRGVGEHSEDQNFISGLR
jgi:hypothetical protein